MQVKGRRRGGGDEVYVEICSRCGKGIMFKEHFARGEEPVWANGRWYCNWSCYSKVRE